MSIVNLAVGDAKLRALILYVALKSQTDKLFGSTKLNKILFYSDFIAYQKLGAPITGQDYMCLPYGPAPRRMKYVMDGMQAEGVLFMLEQDHFGKTQKVPIALRHADLSGVGFTPEQISLVDSVIDAFKDSNARDVSNMSHRFIGWQLATISENIPYSVALVGRRELTPGEVQYGLQLEEAARACR